MSIVDWLILALYMVGMVWLGYAISRRQSKVEDFFSGGRSMPTWAVTFSIVVTALSAGSFVGLPQIGFEKNLTFLWLPMGNVLGGVLASFILIPRLYRAKTITVYGYLGKRFGRGAVASSSLFFLLGQLLSAGARVFIAAIAISYLLFQNIDISNLIITIVVLGIVGTIYTAFGGIQAVIWTDVIQLIIFMGAGFLAIFLLLKAIPMPIGEIVNVLHHAEGGSKFSIASFKLNISNPYTIWTGLIAYSVFNVAQFACDQNMTQRMLTCKSDSQAMKSLIYSRVINVIFVLVFLLVGFLLWIFYKQPELLGNMVPLEALDDTRQVFPQFLINHLPTGFVGITMAGLLAAAMSSFDSSTNAMASILIADFYIPLKEGKLLSVEEKKTLSASRYAVLGMGGILIVFAVIAAFMQEAGGQRLVDFAIGVMIFSYAGLLGVFITAMFTKRGNVKTVIASLIVGALLVFLMQPFVMPYWSNWLFGQNINIAWPWWMVIAGGISFLICLSGKPDSSAKVVVEES